jgi:hypothetical protein
MSITVKKTLGPWGYGLAGYDEASRLALVLPVKPRTGPRWFRRPVTPGDRRRVEEAHRVR